MYAPALINPSLCVNMRNFPPAAKSKTNRRKALEKNTAEIYLKVNRTDKTRNKPNNNKLQFRWEGTVVCNQASPTIQPSNHRTTQQPNSPTTKNRRQTRGSEEPVIRRGRSLVGICWMGRTGKLAERLGRRKFAQLKVLRMQQ